MLLVKVILLNVDAFSQNSAELNGTAGTGPQNGPLFLILRKEADVLSQVFL